MNYRRAVSRSLVLGVLVACLGLAGAVHAGGYGRLSKSDLRSLQESFVGLANEVRPAVVAIRTYHTESDDDLPVFRTVSQGSGVIFRSDGYVLTNYHVVESANHIVIVLNSGREYEADEASVDPRSDLAVLRIDADNLPVATFGDLSHVEIGHWAFAVGNPFGSANFDGRTSFTVGNVSSIGKNLTDQLDASGSRYYGNLIETSAAINPGNSGGPLFNLDGDIIGIVTAIETHTGVSEGLGYAIPISPRTRRIIDQLARGEEVRYGYLGVTTTDPSGFDLYDVGDRSVRGARIRDVLLDGPAMAAGIFAGDVIIELDGTPIEDSDHLVRIVGQTPVGAQVKARIVRRGRQREMTVTLRDRATELARAR